MKINIYIYFIILLVVYFIYNYTFNSPYLVSSNVAKILLRTQKVDIILDVRTNIERQTLGYYPNSINIDSNQLTKLFSGMYPNKKSLILVYCNTGQRARRATDILHKLGYNNTIYIASSHLTLIEKKIFR
jgi:phage shock protein E